MQERAYLAHALSPLHAGTGQAVEIVDLPIARMESTGMPLVPGSSIKGVLRDAARAWNDPERLNAVFGPDKDQAHVHAGALTCADAHLLALPVRSFKGVFAWVTSPLLLTLAQRDLGTVSDTPRPIPDVPARHAAVSARQAAVPKGSINVHESKLYLVDLDLVAFDDGAADEWARFLARQVWPTRPELLTQRFAIVDDDTMAFLWETATQIDARVSIDHQTGTVKDRALWHEESLPPETLLIGLLQATPSFRDGCALSPTQVLDAGLKNEVELQFGGKATVGRGRCRLLPFGSGGAR
jgi:CRISPR-associated protein Cmr4